MGLSLTDPSCLNSMIPIVLKMHVAELAAFLKAYKRVAFQLDGTTDAFSEVLAIR